MNTVNCVGVMGKGIAKQFRERFPDMFRDYKIRCEAEEVRLGRPYLYKRLLTPWILNFPTKEHWRSLARLEDKEIPSEKEVLHEVMQWKRRRRPALDESSIALRIRELAALGGLNVKASADLPIPDSAATDAF